MRAVTQDNRAKRISGVDRISFVSPKERINMAKQLKIDGSASVLRHVYISKVNGKSQLLGIPTIFDRAKQKLVKFVLEPQ